MLEGLLNWIERQMRNDIVKTVSLLELDEDTERNHY